ncbi:MAG: hydrogenase [Tannerella sp.]|jgi:nitrogenase molybdenum-iron protein beta chain|nr:hydrogenase [Tannerella sp.]
MAKILDEPRYVCALGASQTVQAIHRAVPVFHSGPGCAARVSGDASGTGYLTSNTFPCSNIGETEVVFGGEGKLRDIIENSLKVIDGDLYVVMSGCTTEIVGDDIEQVVSEFRDAAKPVIAVSAPGFKGTNYEGHEWVVDALIRQYLTKLPKGERIKGLVNIWGPVPSHEPYWLGDLRELENLVRELGLTPNVIFGEYRGIENLNRVPLAEFNLLVSPWVGLGNVQLLEEKFGTPYLHYPTLPVGAHESSAFLRTVAAFAGLDPAPVEELIARHEKEYYYYIERSVSVFFENRTASKMFSTVTTASAALAVSKFLINDFGLMPNKQYITENVPEEHQERIAGYFRDFNYHIEAEVVFSTDGYLIHRDIEEQYYAGPPLIVGSIFEKQIVKKLAGNFVCVSAPFQQKVVLHSSYVGYHGGLKFLEDLYTGVYQTYN